MAPSERKAHCLCGAVQITLSHPPTSLSACHCSMCRRWTGTALITVDVPAAQLTLEGADHVASYASSDWAARSFCRTCGSTLWYRLTAPGAPDDYYLAAGLLDDLSGMVLDSEIYIDCKPAAYAFAGPTRQMTEAEVLASFGLAASPED